MATTADDWTWVKTFTAITTGGNIPIDIIAQAIGNLNVDINASSIGNIPMNINEQGVGDIYIDLNAQTIDRIIIQDNDGGVESSASAQTAISPSSRETLHSYSGSGSLRYVLYQSVAHSESEYLVPEVKIDGTLLKPFGSYTFASLNALGFNVNTRPFHLQKYAVDGICIGMFYFEKGIVFDSILELKAWNNSGTQTLTAEIAWFYQKLS